MPTKLNLRLQIQDDPLLKYEDTRSHSRVSTLSSEGWKAAYLIQIEIVNLKSLVVLRGDEKSDQFPVSIYLTVHMPCTVLKVYP